MFFVPCVSHDFVSVHCCLFATFWERADPLALVGDVYCIFVTFPCGILGQVWYLILLYTYKKYPLILPIFLHKNTKSCITLLAFSDSVSPSSIVYPRRITFTLVLYLGKTRQRAGI